ncbi:MAG: flagellar assembly protein T N-terminal domain-containing protein, partial [Natronospirillum sp.]
MRILLTWLGAMALRAGMVLSAGLAMSVAASDWRYDPMPEQRFVEATGQAEIAYGDIHSARVRAMRNAVQNASLQVSANVRSEQAVEDGRLT